MVNKIKNFCKWNNEIKIFCKQNKKIINFCKWIDTFRNSTTSWSYFFIFSKKESKQWEKCSSRKLFTHFDVEGFWQFSRMKTLHTYCVLRNRIDLSDDFEEIVSFFLCLVLIVVGFGVILCQIWLQKALNSIRWNRFWLCYLFECGSIR